MHSELTSQGRLSDVCSNNNFPTTVCRGLENLGLEVRWHLRIDGEHR